MCVFPITVTDSPFFFIEDHNYKKSKLDHLERSYEVLKTKVV